MTEPQRRDGRGAGIVGRTLRALSVAARRRDSRAVFAFAGVGYAVLYLLTIGDLLFVEARPVSIRVIDDLGRAFVSTGFFRFDAIAVISVGPVIYLFSPLNVVLASVLATLVAANLALTYLGWVQPSACGLEASTGVLAGVPALLSGAACCGPTILLVLGIQASGTLITAFELLVPVAIVLLVGGLLLIGRRVDPQQLSA